MAVRFQLPEHTNYSAKFFSCHRRPSPYPGHERRKSTLTKHMYRTSACFKAIKHFLKNKHHQPSDKNASNTSSLQYSNEREAERKVNLEWNAARRNAMDLGSRSSYPYRPFNDSSFTLFERELYRNATDPVRRLEAGDSLHENSFSHAVGGPGKENSEMDNLFREDIRTFGNVLAWMHSQGVNVAGYETTEMERKECREGRCRCLGPLARDV